MTLSTYVLPLPYLTYKVNLSLILPLLTNIVLLFILFYLSYSTGRGPAQDVSFDLILWYLAKQIPTF